MVESEWLNTTEVIHSDIEKPCIKLRYCPYGRLVEEYPLCTDGSEYSRLSCATVNGAITQFGHDCPVHYLMEYVWTDQITKKGVLAPIEN